jgi:amino acid transporter
MSEAPAGGIQKTLKRRHLFTLGVGTILGVAWLMVLGSVLASAGPLGAAIGFVIGAGLMIPIGLCYGELAAALPHAGGEIVYAYRLFGERWAFVAGVSLALIYVINCVFFAVSVGWLLNVLVPGVQGPALYQVLGADVHVGDVAIGAVASIATSPGCRTSRPTPCCSPRACSPRSGSRAAIRRTWRRRSPRRTGRGGTARCSGRWP